MLSNFTRKNSNCKVWWLDIPNDDGAYLFSFDKKKIYKLFGDYPQNLTEEEREIFDREEPEWADFFKEGE